MKTTLDDLETYLGFVDEQIEIFSDDLDNEIDDECEEVLLAAIRHRAWVQKEIDRLRSIDSLP